MLRKRPGPNAAPAVPNMTSNIIVILVVQLEVGHAKAFVVGYLAARPATLSHLVTLRWSLLIPVKGFRPELVKRSQKS